MIEDKISVIVPIYKVESYLPRCLDSIIGQSFSDLEIILVDDGSPDFCGSICEEYAEKDFRIKVIHQKNSGVAEARNTGLRYATGRYIGFVDPDDYIEYSFFQKLYEEAITSKADITVCGYCTFGAICESSSLKEGQYDSESALKLLLHNENMPSYLWNKLFAAELFLGIEFVPALRYEDVRVMHLLFQRANQIRVINDSLYHYYLRDDSITGTTRLNNSRELVESYEQRCRDLKNTKLYTDAQISEFMLIRRLLLETIVAKVFDEKYGKKLLLRAKEIYSDCNEYMTRKQKMLSKVFLISPYMYANTIYKLGNLTRENRR